MSQLSKRPSGKEFWAIAENAERKGLCKTRMCKSGHRMVSNKHGATTIPFHGNKPLATGTARSIEKKFKLMGLLPAVIGLLILLLLFICL